MAARAEVMISGKRHHSLDFGVRRALVSGAGAARNTRTSAGTDRSNSNPAIGSAPFTGHATTVTRQPALTAYFTNAAGRYTPAVITGGKSHAKRSKCGLAEGAREGGLAF